MNKVVIKRGDTGWAFTDTLKSDGVAIDLTGATVYFLLQSSTKLVRQTATILNAAAGQVSYTPISTDVDTVGTYQQEWEIAFGGGTVVHVPTHPNNHVKIVADLA